MANYREMTRDALQQEAAVLKKEYEAFQARGLKLDLSRGKPGKDQLALSRDILEIFDRNSDLTAEDGSDCANYGGVTGIPEARRLMGELMGVPGDQVMIGGGSSLNLMHDCLSILYCHGTPASPVPWCKLPGIKFLCPAPGYDRHFAATEHFGFELIPVPMTQDGPDMDLVEQLVAADSAIKGMWNVPKYSNPTGYTYSDETVRRIAALSPAAPDFVLFWDNAYAIHDLYPDEPVELLNVMTELEKNGRQDMILLFGSTAKITFPGAGLAAIGASPNMMDYLVKHFSLQVINTNKVNQLAYARYFKNLDGMKARMRQHADILRPKFEAIIEAFRGELGDTGVASWTEPRGGYFVSFDSMDGCAKRIVELCKEAGVVMTGAGATYPHGQDPRDRNIRVAPSFATLEEIKTAAALFSLCVKIASVEKLLAE